MAQKGVNVELLATKSQLIEKAAGELDTLTSSVQGLQGPLVECWYGVDSDACVNFINQLSSKMTQMSGQVRQVNKWINSVSQSDQSEAASGSRAYQF